MSRLFNIDQMASLRRPLNPLQSSEFSEYEILYTYDITNQKKRWKDGILQFFEFNKKLLVFDDKKRLIHTDFYKLGQNGAVYKIFQEEEILKLGSNADSFPGVQGSSGMLVEIMGLLNVFNRDVTRVMKAKVSTTDNRDTSLQLENKKISIDFSKGKRVSSLIPNLTSPVVKRKMRVGLTRRSVGSSVTRSPHATRCEIGPAESNSNDRDMHATPDAETPKELYPSNSNHEDKLEKSILKTTSVQLVSPVTKTPVKGAYFPASNSSHKRLSRISRNTEDLDVPITPIVSDTERIKVSEVKNRIDQIMSSSTKKASTSRTLKEILLEEAPHGNKDTTDMSKIDVFASSDENEVSEDSDCEEKLNRNNRKNQDDCCIASNDNVFNISRKILKQSTNSNTI